MEFLPKIAPTALLNAAARAIETTRPDRLFADAFAANAATPEAYDWLERAGGRALVDVIAVRTTWIDGQIARAFAEGTRTVVLLAAGLDARPWRLSQPARTRWIVVDQPEVMKLRQTSLKTLSTCVPTHDIVSLSGDLRTAKTLALVAHAIRAKSERTLIVLEGLLAYIEAHEVSILLRRLARLCTGDCEILFDVPNSQSLDGTGPLGAQLSVLDSLNSPMRFGCDQPDALLASVGLQGETLTLSQVQTAVGRIVTTPMQTTQTYLVRARRIERLGHSRISIPEDPTVEYYDSDHPSPSPQAAADVARVLAVTDNMLAQPSVLELGCGTGRLTIALARAGLQVFGEDLSTYMLYRLRAKLQLETAETGKRISLRQRDFTKTTRSSQRYDVAVLSHNTLGLLGGFAEQRNALLVIAKRLRKGGRLLVDMSNPHILPPAGDGTLRPMVCATHPVTGLPYTRFAATSPMDSDQRQVVSGWYDQRQADGSNVRRSYAQTFRFVFRYELELMLEEAGFRDVVVDAGVQAAAWTPASARIVACAVKT